MTITESNAEPSTSSRRIYDPFTYIGGKSVQFPHRQGFEGAIHGTMTRPIKESDIGALVSALESTDKGEIKTGRDVTKTVRTHGVEVRYRMSQEEELRDYIKTNFPNTYARHFKLHES